MKLSERWDKLETDAKVALVVWLGILYIVTLFAIVRIVEVVNV